MIYSPYSFGLNSNVVNDDSAKGVLYGYRRNAIVVEGQPKYILLAGGQSRGGRN